MKKIVFIFLLFSTITFAQKENLKVDVRANLEPNELVIEIKKFVDLTADQEIKMFQHLKKKKDYFSTIALSDLRKQIVLNVYKEEFDNILNVNQLALFNKNNKSLYLYITSN